MKSWTRFYFSTPPIIQSSITVSNICEKVYSDLIFFLELNCMFSDPSDRWTRRAPRRFATTFVWEVVKMPCRFVNIEQITILKIRNPRKWWNSEKFLICYLFQFFQVTQTSVSAGHFEAKLYHMVFEEEFARFKVFFLRLIYVSKDCHILLAFVPLVFFWLLFGIGKIAL